MPDLRITKDTRARYEAIVSARINEKIHARTVELERLGNDRDAFLRERGIFDEYVEFTRLEDKLKALKETIQSVLGSCNSIDYVIREYVKNRIQADPAILELRKKLRGLKERIILAKNYDELDAVLGETNDEQGD